MTFVVPFHCLASSLVVEPGTHAGHVQVVECRRCRRFLVQAIVRDSVGAAVVWPRRCIPSIQTIHNRNHFVEKIVHSCHRATICPRQKNDVALANRPVKHRLPSPGGVNLTIALPPRIIVTCPMPRKTACLGTSVGWDGSCN